MLSTRLRTVASWRPRPSPRRKRSPLRILAPLLGLVLLTAGCAGGPRALMPTPAGFVPPVEASVFATVLPERRGTSEDLLYITNRKPEQDAALPYGQQRSRSLAFGSATVRMQPAMSWETLQQLSLSAQRAPEVSLELGAVRELGRFPPEPYALVATPTGMRRDAAVMAEHQRVADTFHAEMHRRLALAPSGKVMLYIHGFNETFATAAYTAAELCHFLGRDQVCALFTWPASSTGNFLTSFTQTTESAQFSVGHLKQTIRALARNPEVEGVQLLAHSRGAALLLDALRELYIEAIAAGEAPAKIFKLDQVVMLSADVDTEVASQRILIYSSDPEMITRWEGADLPELFRGRVTVYTSPQDRALLVSRILFRSGNRIGQLSADALTGDFVELFDRFGRLDVVTYDGQRTDFFGHSFFTSNPRVSADLITLLRTGAPPDAPSRGLLPTGPISWVFPPLPATTGR